MPTKRSHAHGISVHALTVRTSEGENGEEEIKNKAKKKMRVNMRKMRHFCLNSVIFVEVCAAIFPS